MNRSAAELDVGEAGRVGEVTGDGDITRRLLEMGITPGAQIRRLGLLTGCEIRGDEPHAVFREVVGLSE